MPIPLNHPESMSWMLVTATTQLGACEECNRRITGNRIIGPQRLLLCFSCTPTPVLRALGAVCLVCNQTPETFGCTDQICRQHEDEGEEQP